MRKVLQLNPIRVMFSESVRDSSDSLLLSLYLNIIKVKVQQNLILVEFAETVKL